MTVHFEHNSRDTDARSAKLAFPFDKKEAPSWVQFSQRVVCVSVILEISTAEILCALRGEDLSQEAGC